MPHNPETERILSETMKAHGLETESVLYRETLEEFLYQDESTGEWRISANDDPSEAVIDLYEGEHVTLAAHVGPGLAFTLNRGSQWADPGRATVALRLGDALDQGGFIYPVESVTTDTVWYVTLPDGAVRVSRD